MHGGDHHAALPEKRRALVLKPANVLKLFPLSNTNKPYSQHFLVRHITLPHQKTKKLHNNQHTSSPDSRSSASIPSSLPLFPFTLQPF